MTSFRKNRVVQAPWEWVNSAGWAYILALRLIFVLCICLAGVGAFLFANFQASDYSGEPKVVYRHMLPVWTGDPGSLLSAARPLIYDSILQWEQSTTLRDAPLVEGATLTVHQGICSNAALVVSLKERRAQRTFEIKANRDMGFFERIVSNCLFGAGGPLHGVYLLKDRYIAFYAVEPGWVLFDLKQGDFLDLVIRTDMNALSEIGLDHEGSILVSHTAGLKGLNKRPGKSVSVDPSYQPKQDGATFSDSSLGQIYVFSP